MVTLRDTDEPAVHFLFMNFHGIGPLVNSVRISLVPRCISSSHRHYQLLGKTQEIYHLPQLQEVMDKWYEFCQDEEGWAQYEREQEQRVEAAREVRASML